MPLRSTGRGPLPDRRGPLLGGLDIATLRFLPYASCPSSFKTAAFAED